MSNSKVLFRHICDRITVAESRGEVEAMVEFLFAHLKGVSHTQLLAGKEVEITESEAAEWAERINRHEPVQYIAGVESFFGRLFAVNSNVLIPRPETEQIVRIVLASHPSASKILDVGTGSGCLAVTLALEIPDALVWALDISPDAMRIAQSNALRHRASVSFHVVDFLDPAAQMPDGLDILVSNPPYIRDSERSSMSFNVKDYEPSIALFVRDQDPLIFYRAMAAKAPSILRPGGRLVVEINEALGKEVAQLWDAHGLKDIIIHKDLDGKDRVVSAYRI